MKTVAQEDLDFLYDPLRDSYHGVYLTSRGKNWKVVLEYTYLGEVPSPAEGVKIVVEWYTARYGWNWKAVVSNRQRHQWRIRRQGEQWTLDVWVHGAAVRVGVYLTRKQAHAEMKVFTSRLKGCRDLRGRPALLRL